LAGEPDFAKVGRKASWRDHAEGYRVPYSHWHERLYGLYNEHSAFEDDWLAVSDWIEGLLTALLHVPGSGDWALAGWNLDGAKQASVAVEARLKQLLSIQGQATGCMILPVHMPRPIRSDAARPLRACVMQTVIPTAGDFRATDLTLSAPAIRARHRAHLAELAKRVEAGHGEETPEHIDTPGRRALYSNLNQNEELAMKIDDAIRRVRPDAWRGVPAREQAIKQALFEELHDVDQVERMFLIIKQQKEY
jgi:hypothetical protein